MAITTWTGMLLTMQSAPVTSAIEASISSSGEATPQPGDLVGEARPVTLGEADSPVEVTIDRIIE
ncbi:hypothetical protein GCM10007160_12010 [Litchfieldella qijiaojingensis]|uniref:Cytochrome c-type biogenesis protein H Ig-like domain-containing protein n=1 Tax=Litchfieldella qijiaojingensis TaxID=980347 RepID=A0ABQ2YK21_9GAMM|nr:hypothetical protein [Halomonas qijiaojingensis]GGX86323.1 hypothetical protein GCM10007160_12010 [Halomonas qijiaojingensis]